MEQKFGKNGIDDRFSDLSGAFSWDFLPHNL